MGNQQRILGVIERHGFREIIPEFKKDQFIYGARYLLWVNSVGGDILWQFTQAAVAYGGFTVWSMMENGLVSYGGVKRRSQLPGFVEIKDYYRLFLQAPAMFPRIELSPDAKNPKVDYYIDIDTFLDDDGNRAYMAPGVINTIEERYPTDKILAEKQKTAMLLAELEQLRREKELAVLWGPVRTLESAAAKVASPDAARFTMAANRLRDAIQRQLDNGKTPEEIIAIRELRGDAYSKVDVTPSYPYMGGAVVTYAAGGLMAAAPNMLSSAPPQAATAPEPETKAKRRIVLNDDSF